MITWFKNLYWKWYWWKNPKKHLVRSELYQRKIKELLLEDLNSMKFKDMI